MRMPIHLKPAQIDAALQRVGEGLNQYEWLQANVANQHGFENDPEFRRRFNRFYRVRRGQAWQDRFYSLMGRTKVEGLQFRDVLLEIRRVTSQYEASFASKLVATLDPLKPMIDAFVLKNVGLRLPSYAADDRADRICEVYAELIAGFSAFLAGDDGKYLVSAFSRTYPRTEITEVKKLDLVLWQTRA